MTGTWEERAPCPGKAVLQLPEEHLGKKKRRRRRKEKKRS
jgi:hypothetical protein